MNLWNKTIVSVALEEQEEEENIYEKVLEVIKKAKKEKEERYEKLRKNYIKELNARLISLAAATEDDFPDNYISTGHAALGSFPVEYTLTPWLNSECLNQISDYYTSRGFKTERVQDKNSHEEWLRIFLPSLDEEEK